MEKQNAFEIDVLKRFFPSSLDQWSNFAVINLEANRFGHMKSESIRSSYEIRLQSLIEIEPGKHLPLIFGVWPVELQFVYIFPKPKFSKLKVPFLKSKMKISRSFCIFGVILKTVFQTSFTMIWMRRQGISIPSIGMLHVCYDLMSFWTANPNNRETMKDKAWRALGHDKLV